jgi:hypothetical protein
MSEQVFETADESIEDYAPEYDGKQKPEIHPAARARLDALYAQHGLGDVQPAAAEGKDRPLLAELKNGLWYVASPYSKYPKGIHAAFVEVSRFAALLLRAGVRTFVPIAHSHPIAIYGGIDPLIHAIWRPFNAAVMAKCDGLIVCMMEGWQESFGVGEEIKEFTKAGKRIVYLEHDGDVDQRPTPVRSETPRTTFVLDEETLPSQSILKDSGTRSHFETGAVRDGQEGKGRMDLLPMRALRELSMLYEAGSKKYGDRNWEKGIPTHRYVDSAMRHLAEFMSGHADERHATAAFWNVAGLIDTMLRIREGLLPASLNTLPFPLESVALFTP